MVNLATLVNMMFFEVTHNRPMGHPRGNQARDRRVVTELDDDNAEKLEDVRMPQLSPDERFPANLLKQQLCVNEADYHEGRSLTL